MSDISVKVFESEDPRLDWVSMHDPRSQNYGIAERLVSAVEIEPKKYNAGVTIDQGREGACVGFGWTQEAMTSPRPHKTIPQTAQRKALEWYRRAQVIDEWPGENYSGTSVLAGAKVGVEMNYITEYRWAFSIEEVRDAIIQNGPVVIGIPWFDSMYETRESGLVLPMGDIVGGHCIVLDEYHPNKRLRGEDYDERFNVFGFHNSWGEDYGIGGRGYFIYEDLRDLLNMWGEACVPMGRKIVRF